MHFANPEPPFRGGDDDLASVLSEVLVADAELAAAEARRVRALARAGHLAFSAMAGQRASSKAAEMALREVASEIAAAEHLSDRSVQAQIGRAVELVDDYPVPVGIAAVAVLTGGSIVVSVTTGMDTRFLQVGLTAALAGALGDAARSRRAYVRAVIERARRAEQTRDAEARRRVTEERLRIARDLHDAVAHQISVISLNAGVASSALDTRPERAREALATIRTASREVLGEIGSMLTLLRTPDEADSRTQPGLARLADMVESVRVAGWEAVVRDELGLPSAAEDLPLSVDIVAYRVVQEGMTNALKHGTARRVHVLLRRDGDELEVVVTNPVDRVAPASELPPSGFGLVGLRERVDSVGGVLEAGPAPGGFRLAARLPLAPAAGAMRVTPGGAA